MATTTTTDYTEMLESLRSLAVKAAGVPGADSVGAFHPIPNGPSGQYRAYGDSSSLSEFLDDFADVLQDFLAKDGEEIEGWEA